MKKFLILSAAIAFFSCQSNSGGGKTINDTSVVAFRPLGTHGRNWTGGTISYSISKSKDTFNWKVFQTGDTLRTPSGHPVYDSINKAYKFNTGWFEITDSQLRKVQILFFPK